MIRVLFGKGFDKDYDELVLFDQTLKKLVLRKVELFKKNPDDTRLKNHQLRRKMAGKWAFSITDDIRIVYEWEGRSTVRFLAIGGHDHVYS